MTALPPASILDVTPEQYHKLPGLSPSTAWDLYSRCAAIARDRYLRATAPAAEPDGEDSETKPEVPADKQAQLDRGDILHALLLGVGKRIEIIPTDKLSKNGSYGTAESKALRDEARALGRIPVKEHKMATYHQAADAIRAQLEDAGHAFHGRSEVAIEWWEPSPRGPVRCRTMIDHLMLFEGSALVSPSERPTGAKVLELKLPGDAAPDRSERTADGLGHHVAAAARLRALNTLFPSLAGRIEYRFLLCESSRPYAFWAPTPTGSFLEYGERVWRTAVAAWGEGEATGQWLNYNNDILRQQIDLPRWRKMAEGFTDAE